MAGTLETLPASPCSATSDDNTSVHPPPSKRLRLDHHPPTPFTSLTTLDIPPSSASLPSLPSLPTPTSVSASVSASEPDPPAVSPPAVPDERRLFLLTRLQAISEKKANLVATRPADKAPSTPDSDVQFVQETRPSKPFKNLRSRKPKPPPNNKQLPSPTPSNTPSVINIDDDPIPVSPSPLHSSNSSKSHIPDSSLAPTRTSSRVRRPRLPSHDPNHPQHSDKSSRTPACMAKCKRLQFCKKLISTMLRDKASSPFAAPVHKIWLEHAIPNYFDIIARPMDLGTIRKQLDTSVYIRPVTVDTLPYRFDVDKFTADVRLVFRNAMVYNRSGDAIHNTAQALLDDFDNTILQQLPVLPKPEVSPDMASKAKPSKKRSAPVPPPPRKPASRSSDAARRRKRRPPTNTTALLDRIAQKGNTRNAAGVEKSAARKGKASKKTVGNGMEESELDLMSSKELKDRLSYLQRCRVPVLARTPVGKGEGYLSKAALLYDIEMDHKQKAKVAEFIQKVPLSKKDAMVKMIQASQAADQTSEMLEVDMDNLDNRTLRNLEAFFEQFMPGFKTIRSSSLGREYSSVSELQADILDVREKLNQMNREKAKAAEAEETGLVVESGASNVDKPKSFFGEEEGNVSSSDSDSSDSSSDEESDSDDNDSDSE